MKTLRLGLLLTCLSLGSAAARGESFPLTFVAPPELGAEARRSLQDLVRRNADEMYDVLLKRIDQIHEACDLTDAQRQVLVLAAKGAVQDSLDAWAAPIQSALGTNSTEVSEAMSLRLKLVDARGRLIPAGNAHLVIQQGIVFQEGGFFAPVRVQGAQLVDAQAVLQTNGISLDIDCTSVLRHEVFVNAVASTLTGDQREKARDLKSPPLSEEARMQATRLANFVGIQLALNVEQRAEVKRLIEEFDDQEVRDWLQGRSTRSRTEVAISMSLRLPKDRMEAILSPSQNAQWLKLLEEIAVAQTPIVPAGGQGL